MKKLTLIFTLVTALTLGNKVNVQAQEDKRAQNVFVEVLGQGLLFSANYDTRFGNRRDGLGGRAGIGYIGADGSSVTTVPISLNYLLGNGKNFFEIGLGATFASATVGDSFLFEDDEEATGNGVIGTMSFAYRLQPVNSGFAFRAGLSPIFNKNNFIPYYFGLSLGYTF